MAPLVNSAVEDVVPTIKEALVATLQDDAFTSDVKRLCGPMVAQTLKDPDTKATVTTVIKDWTLDTVDDAEFTAVLSAHFERALADANSSLRKALLAGANKALNPFAGRNGASTASPLRADALRKQVEKAFRTSNDELVDFSVVGLADEPGSPRPDFDITPDGGSTPVSTPNPKAKMSSPKTF